MREAVAKSDMKGVTADIVCDRFSDDGWVRTSIHVPREMKLTIYINHRQLVSILCTPTKLNCLILGFLYSEGIISDMGDVMMMRVCEDDSLADVMLSNPEYEPPTERTLTPGCGGGATFKTQGERVDSNFVVSPVEVFSLLKQLQEQMELYQLSGGIHTSALADAEKLLVVAEDIGRHNTMDKIQGECIATGVSTRDRLLLTTGRISSEMLLKAAKMQAPVVVSRHTPTGAAVSLANDLGITLVGRARRGNLSVYSHPERLGRPAYEIEPTDEARTLRAQKNLMR